VDGEGHYGARHSTALNYSADRDLAIVFAVSQDGGVTVFFRGQKVAAIKIT
jgi:DNA integrity scanning protein DisA with diadenylate cyclase activity